MLRFVEHGHAVQMVPVLDDGVAVDTPEDLTRAKRFLDQLDGAVHRRGTVRPSARWDGITSSATRVRSSESPALTPSEQQLRGLPTRPPERLTR